MGFSISSAAFSGLAAASARLQASAHNVANANTPDFAPQRVALQEAPGGVRALVEQPADPGFGVDLATERVEQLAAARSYEANLKVLESWSEQLDTLLDVVG